MIDFDFRWPPSIVASCQSGVNRIILHCLILLLLLIIFFIIIIIIIIDLLPFMLVIICNVNIVVTLVILLSSTDIKYQCKGRYYYLITG